MAESLSDWLALREAADFAARSPVLTKALVAHLPASEGPLRILDLGTGTGSNIRYLAPVLGPPQDWLAVDRDARLLAAVAARSATLAPRIRVATRLMDLGRLDATEIFEGRHLVTASALLDLVSDGWLARLASQCRRAGAMALFTITYNGRNECDPRDPDDERVFELFNRHQLTDKGLGGPAVGPRGAETARRHFRDAGYGVTVEPSDWNVGPEEREFQRRLIDGWAYAAAEMAAAERSRIEAWRERRLRHVLAGRSRVIVGHDDLLANPSR